MKFIFITCVLLLSGMISEAQSNTATVYFIRERALEGSVLTYYAYMDDQMLCKINNSKYSVHEVPVGPHLFAIQFPNRKPDDKTEGAVTITLEPGKTYYQKANPVSQLVRYYIGLVEVTENAFNKLKPGLNLDDKCQ